MHPAIVPQGLFVETDNKRTSFFQPSQASLFVWLVASTLFVVCISIFLHFTERAFLPTAAEAASTDYTASIVSLSAPRTLPLGGTGSVIVTLKNIGSATWKKDGANYASLYHWDPSRHVETTSVFSTAGWNSDKRAVRVTSADVAPGQSVTLQFPIRAPSVAGTYQESFTLTAENAAWVRYGVFTLSIQVGGAAQAVAQAPASTPTTVVTAPTAPAPATIAPRTDWAAELVTKGGSEWQITIGDHVVTEIAYKNVGTKTWKRDGEGFVSLYATEGTKERASAFKDFNWISASQAVRLKEIEVKPGQIGHFVLELRAPQNPSFFQESFTLAAEDTAWVYGSGVVLPIRVPINAQYISSLPVESGSGISVADNLPSSASGYLASLLLRSASNLVLLGNGRQTLTYGFKNTGDSAWNTFGLRIRGVQPALAGSLSSVRDDSWLSSAEPVRVQASTKPGEVGFVKFTIKAPAKKGTYTASFQLFADEHSVEGGVIDIPITVTADGYIEPLPTVAPKPSPTTQGTTPTPAPAYNAIPLTGDASTLPNEPIIRVGLFKTTDDKMIVLAKYVAVNVTQNGSTVCRLNIGESATIAFDRTNKVYKISGGSCGGQSTSVYLFKAEDGISAMEIADYARPVSWLPGANDNKFRAQLELRYTPSSDSVWIINELPVESYLKGIAETSNSSPQEYQRALLTAARTYAMYHVYRGTKHASENFTVDATYDQVYRGYGAEARDPNVVAAINATRGQIVTYNGTLAITPYYSRSDGRTRSWTEVWGGGPYAWLVGVSVPWDQGKTLWGHGVGMSATGALGMAADGWTYDRILKHFYTGIELRRAYK